MSNEAEEQKGTIGEIAENLGPVFRHLLPGALIIGTARVAHPTWFATFNAYSWPYLTVVGVVAIAVGNAWFSVNRYVIHQIVDYFCWKRKLQGPAMSVDGNYIDDLAKYVREAFIEDARPLARQHVSFRASSVLLIYTISELLIFAAISSESCAITSGWIRRLSLGLCGLVLFRFGLWQNVITRRIDAAVLHQKLVR